MRILHRDIWLCVDCLMVTCNGDTSGIESEERLVKINAGLHRLGPDLVPDYNDETGEGWEDEIGHYETRRPCHCCKDPSHGSRFRFAILGKSAALSKRLAKKFREMSAWVALNPGQPKRRLLDVFYKSTPGTPNGTTSGYRAIDRAVKLGYFKVQKVGSAQLLYPTLSSACTRVPEVVAFKAPIALQDRIDALMVLEDQARENGAEKSAEETREWIEWLTSREWIKRHFEPSQFTKGE